MSLPEPQSLSAPSAPSAPYSLRLHLRVLSSDCVRVPLRIAAVDSLRGLALGRDSSPAPLLRLKELGVSRVHARIFAVAAGFCIQDCGSTHGSFLNGQRLAESKCGSEPVELKHLDMLVIGSTTFEVHIHEAGAAACDDCAITEDNLIPTNAQPKSSRLTDGSSDKTAKRKRVEPSPEAECASNSLPSTFVDVEPDEPPPPPENFKHRKTVYIDRAALRRKQFGTTNSYDIESFRSVHNSQYQMISATPAPASGVDDHAATIKVGGVGESLLMKLGWRPGTGVGRLESGIQEPIKAVGSSGRNGLGLPLIYRAVPRSLP